MKTHHFLLAVVAALGSSITQADSQKDLYDLVQSGSLCEQTQNNGLICNYAINNGPVFSIKDAGGTDTVIGVRHSDMDEMFYLVMYKGCLVVVPGRAHPAGYDREYGVYISPVTGRTYINRKECEATK